MPLLCSLAEPFHRLGGILRHAFAVVIRQAKFVLRLGKPLLSGLAIPFYRFLEVFPNAVAVGVSLPEADRWLLPAVEKWRRLDKTPHG